MVIIGKRTYTYDDFFEHHFHSWVKLNDIACYSAMGKGTDGQPKSTNVYVPFGVFDLNDDKEKVIKYLRRKLLSDFTQGAVVYEVERSDNIGHVVKLGPIPGYGIGVYVDMVNGGTRTDRAIYLPEQLKVL